MPSVWREKRGDKFIVCWYVHDKKQKRSRCAGASAEDAAEFMAKKWREVRREALGLPLLPADECAEQITVADYLKRYVRERRSERSARTVEHFDMPAAACMTVFWPKPAAACSIMP